MIDNFSLGLTHGLMLLAAWYLLRRPDLDREGAPQDDAAAPPPAPPRRSRWGRRDA
jgi:hypothetical protein